MSLIINYKEEVNITNFCIFLFIFYIIDLEDILFKAMLKIYGLKLFET